jgi:hypothetical protein
MAPARTLLALAAFAVVSCAASAHELADNRATLVLRDRTHLSLTLFIRYTEAVHRALAPRASYGEFLLALSTMSAGDFEKQLRRAHDSLQSGIRVTVDGGREAMLSNWTWPDPGRAQKLFQREVMEATVGDEHRHAEPVEIRADVASAAAITSASVRFGAAFGNVLLVWYQPRQTWVEAGQASPTVRFR